jgi:hypothetical protein
MIRMLAFALLLMPTTPAAAQGECKLVTAGIVLDFAGAPDGYRLQRGGRDIAFGTYAELRPGDRVRVVSRGGSMAVARGDDTVTRFGYEDGTICIAPGRVPSWAGNVWQMFGDLIRRRRSGEGSLVTRGRELALLPPDLARGSARVTVGLRPFAVAWYGGVAPFAVTVSGPSGIIVSEAGLDAQVLRLQDPRNLMAGTYTVTVRDAVGANVSGAFTAIREGSVVVAGTAEAAILAAGAKLGKGQDRRFDAFISLAPYRKQNESAAAIAEVLTRP